MTARATGQEADRRRRFADIRPAEDLAPHVVAITLQRLVMEAGANRDFARIHFDREAARATGAPDVYANTTFLETILESALRRWAGRDAQIREIAFTMRRFNCVGDTLTAGGAVLELRPVEQIAEVELWIESAHGRTVEGAARVWFP